MPHRGISDFKLFSVCLIFKEACVRCDRFHTFQFVAYFSIYLIGVVFVCGPVT